MEWLLRGLETNLINQTTIQVYFNQLNSTHMNAACFGLYLDHLHACQYREYMQDVVCVTHTVRVLTVMYHPIYALCDTPFMTCVSMYVHIYAHISVYDSLRMVPRCRNM